MQHNLLDHSLGTVHQLLHDEVNGWGQLAFDMHAMNTVLAMPWPLSFLIAESKFETVGLNMNERFPRGTSLMIYFRTWGTQRAQDAATTCANDSDDDQGSNSDHDFDERMLGDAQNKLDKNQLMNPSQFQQLADYLRSQRNVLTAQFHDHDEVQEAHTTLDSHIQWLERCVCPTI